MQSQSRRAHVCDDCIVTSAAAKSTVMSAAKRRCRQGQTCVLPCLPCCCRRLPTQGEVLNVLQSRLFTLSPLSCLVLCYVQTMPLGSVCWVMPGRIHNNKPCHCRQCAEAGVDGRAPVFCLSSCQPARSGRMFTGECVR